MEPTTSNSSVAILNTTSSQPKIVQNEEHSNDYQGHSEDNHVNTHDNTKKSKNGYEVTSPTLSDSYPSHKHELPSSQEASPQQSPASPKQNGSNTGVKLFIGQVPKHFNDAEVRKIFEPYGKILSCDIIKDRATQMHKGCAFLTFTTKSEAEAAIAALHDKLTLPPAKSALQVLFAVGELERLEHKLFVGMLPVGTTEEDLRPVFATIGELEDLAMIRQPPSATKRCAFVKYKTREDAQQAINTLNGYKMEKNGVSSLITVKFADTEKSKKQKQMQKMQQQQNVYMPPASYPPYQYTPYPTQYVPYTMPSSVPTMTPTLTGNYPGYAYPSVPSTYTPYVAPYQQTQPAPVSQVPVPQVPQVTPQAQAKILTSQGMQPATTYQGGFNYGTAPAVNNYTAASSSYGAAPSSYGATPSNYGAASSGYGATPTHGSNAPHNSGPPGANLFIYDVPPSYRDHDLYSLFASFGSIVSAKVFIDKNTGESKCFGFVSYSTPESAQSAIAHMNGVQIGEKRLKVSLKRDSQIASQAKTVGSRYTPY